MERLIKTLLVEDERVTRRVVETILQSRGHDVTACGDAEEAWAFFQSTPYPLVVLDLGLPGMDGVELCRKIRESRERSFIVVLTGSEQEEDLQALLDAGADDYLVKND